MQAIAASDWFEAFNYLNQAAQQKKPMPTGVVTTQYQYQAGGVRQESSRQSRGFELIIMATLLVHSSHNQYGLALSDNSYAHRLRVMLSFLRHFELYQPTSNMSLWQWACALNQALVQSCRGSQKTEILEIIEAYLSNLCSKQEDNISLLCKQVLPYPDLDKYVTGWLSRRGIDPPIRGNSLSRFIVAVVLIRRCMRNRSKIRPEAKTVTRSTTQSLWPLTKLARGGLELIRPSAHVVEYQLPPPAAALSCYRSVFSPARVARSPKSRRYTVDLSDDPEDTDSGQRRQRKRSNEAAMTVPEPLRVITERNEQMAIEEELLPGVLQQFP